MRANDFIAVSDARLKDNIVTIESPLEKVSAIRGVTHTWKNDLKNRVDMGVIAQEVQAVCPELVREDELGNLSVSYGHMTGLLVEAIKELRMELGRVKTELELLKSFSKV